MREIFIVVCVVFISETCGDIYFHNPRGSNNRQDENKRERTNANRLFDSQNNNRGGYNVGAEPMYYYQGSKLQMEWTNQHSCENPNNHCELIIQYMCGENVRDGTTTQRIPLDKEDCEDNDCNTDEEFGMHEPYEYYGACRLRERNKGLYTADQNMNGRETAVSTRQERNGKNNRYGYECTEERDYFPYWHPSPWKDIAVLTNDVRRCAYYRAESANVKSRWACVFSVAEMEELDGEVKSLPNNKQDCESSTFGPDNNVKGVWTEIPAHGLAAPDCRETQFSRDNHLGNGLDGNPNRYNWTIPATIEEENCVMRIRYNISTNEYDAWNTNATQNNNNKGLNLAAKYGFTDNTEAKARGYEFEGDPEVNLFDEGSFNFRLAFDTSQFGRTFQDRSHKFAIRKRPANMAASATVHNLNVRGKRGNIVQVYPAVEYDFVPNVLEMSPGEFVHFQWTGSDNNPQNNDGQGQKGTDRSNVLLLRGKNYPEGNGVQYGPAPTYGQYGNNYPQYLNTSDFLGLEVEDLTKLAFLEPGKVGEDLNEASPYFDLGPRQVNKLGTYHYVSTRNNDFSNRDQKARIMVSTMTFNEIALGWQGGALTLPNGAGTVQVDEGVFDSLHLMRLEMWPKDQGQKLVEATGNSLKAGTDFVSDFLVLYPESTLANAGKSMSVSLKVDGDASNVAVYRSTSSSNFATWTKLDTDVDGDTAKFEATAGGVYVAKSHGYTVLIVALVVSVLVVVLIIVGGVCYFKRNPSQWEKLKDKTTNIKRDYNSQI